MSSVRQLTDQRESVIQTRVIRDKLTQPRFQPWLLYAAYVGLALAVFLTFPRQPDLGDNYHGQALNILQGKGFSDPSLPKSRGNLPDCSLLSWWDKYGLAFGSTRPNQPTARCMPLYPLWLAFWFMLFGFESPVVHILQILVMGLTLPLVYYLARKLFQRNTAGVMAGAILLFHPHLLRYPGSFPSETLFIPLFVGGLAAWFWVRENPTPMRLTVYSLIWALAALTREMGIFYGLFSLVLLLIATPALRRYFYVPLVVMVVMWSPWVIRNAVVMGEARLFPTRMGYNLWLTYNRIYLNRFLDARNPQAKLPDTYFLPPENESILKDVYGLDDNIIQEYRQYDFPLEIMEASEVQINHALMQRARLFMRNHPEIVIKFSADRLLDAFVVDLDGLGQRSLKGLNEIYLLALFITGLAGLIYAFSSFKKYWYILVMCILFFGFLATGPWGARYRLPVDPLLALFAGGLILQIFSRRGAKKIRG